MVIEIQDVTKLYKHDKSGITRERGSDCYGSLDVYHWAVLERT